MISSEYIIKLVESLTHPQDEKEIILTSWKIISGWLSGMGSRGLVEAPNYDQSRFLFISKNVKDSVYTGKAYRLIWLDVKQLKKQKFISKDEDAINLSTKQIRLILSSNKTYLSKLASWSKTLRGLKAAEAELIKPKVKTISVLISDNVTGIDIDSVFKWIKSVASTSSDPDLMSTVSSYGQLYNTQKWADTQTEIVAPLNSNSFQVEAIDWSTNPIKSYGKISKKKPVVFVLIDPEFLWNEDGVLWGSTSWEFDSKETSLNGYSILSDYANSHKSTIKMSLGLTRPGRMIRVELKVTDKDNYLKISHDLISYVEDHGFFVDKMY